MKTIKRKVFAVSQWLKQNAMAYNTSNMDDKKKMKDERIKLAKYYVDRLGDDIHDVKITRRNGHTGTEFYLRIGNPKFRGSVNYNLHSHSLRFRSLNSTSVSLVLSGDINPVSYENVKEGLASFREDEIERHFWDDMFKKIACHPHISRNGEPCLGGWGNAFATCITTANIVSLRNVAQSFLNTWTADDAYYNINAVRREWLKIPTNIRKFYAFRDWLVIKEFWLEVKVRLDSRQGHMDLNPSYFIRWLQDNEESVLSYLQMKNFKEGSMIELHMQWGAVIASLKSHPDTEDGLLGRWYVVNDISYRTYESIMVRLNNEYQMSTSIAWALASDAVVHEHRQSNLRNPFRYNGETTFPLRETLMASDYIKNENRSRISQDITWAAIFELQRELKRGNNTPVVTYLDKSQIYPVWKKWLENRYYMKSFWVNLNSIITYANIVSTNKHMKFSYFNYRDFVDKPFERIDEYKIESVYEVMCELQVAGEDFLPMNLRVNHYVKVALNIYIDKLEEYKGELENAEERRSEVQYYHNGQPSSQDSVSVESF